MSRSSFLRAPLAAALAAICLIAALTAPDALARSGPKPTVVLVHGAFADASGFGAVISRLQQRGYTVISPANPLRGPASDAAYVASVIKTRPTSPTSRIRHRSRSSSSGPRARSADHITTIPPAATIH